MDIKIVDDPDLIQFDDSEFQDKTLENPGDYEVLSQAPKGRNEKSSIPELMEYRRFPVDVLPSELAEYITQVSQSVCCDASFVALPLLAGLAAAVGNSMVLQVKGGWSVPSILWCAVVAPSGSAKSVPPKKALKSMYRRQSRLVKQFEKDWQGYERDQKTYEKQYGDWKKLKGQSSLPDPPVPPEPPVCQRLIVSDSTIEALGKRLKDNPRGVLAFHDELTKWFGAFNRYKASSSDEAHWLEFYNGSRSVIDRTSSPKPLMIERASVSLFGTIQPGILRKHLTADYKASGLAARLLFAMPPRQKKQWNEFEVQQHLESFVETLFENLLSIEMQVSEDGDSEPAIVKLDESAKELFIQYYNRHNREQQELDEELYAAYSKLEEVAARIALVIHAVRFSIGEIESQSSLDAKSMAVGIELTEWFKNEAKRVYTVLSESDIAYENRQILQWIASQGGAVSPRDLHRGQRSKFTCTEEAEVLLQSFAKAGIGSMVVQPASESGGRPSYKFQLEGLGQNPQKTNDFEGFVTEAVSMQEWRP